MSQPPNIGVAQDSALRCSLLDIYWVSGGLIRSRVLNTISMLTAPVLPSYLISRGSSKLPIQHLHCMSKGKVNPNIVKTKLPIFSLRFAPFTLFFISVSDVSLLVVWDNTLAAPLISLFLPHSMVSSPPQLPKKLILL